METALVEAIRDAAQSLKAEVDAKKGPPEAPRPPISGSRRYLSDDLHARRREVATFQALEIPPESGEISRNVKRPPRKNEQRKAKQSHPAPTGGQVRDPLSAQVAQLPDQKPLLDRYAGIMITFGSLEERLREALDAGNTREVDDRLFGGKHDSLGMHLERVVTDVRAGMGDPVEHYVVTLCARKLLHQLAHAYPEYWAEHHEDVKALENHLAQASGLRDLAASEFPGLQTFFGWFDPWFVQGGPTPTGKKVS